MKIRIMLKCPDCAEQGISDAMEQYRREIASDGCGVSEEDDAAELQKAKDAVDNFVKYGECVTIEVDSDDCTAIVLPAGG